MTYFFLERPGLRRLLLACCAGMLTACGGSDTLSSSDSQQSSSASQSSSSTTFNLPAYLYVASTNSDSQGNPQPGTVNGFAIKSDGSLTPLTSTVAIGLPPTAMVSDPSGRYVYVVNGDGSVDGYSVQPSNGMLTPLTTGATITTATLQSVQASIDPSGRFYVVLQPAATMSLPIMVVYSMGADGTLQSPQMATTASAPASGGPLAFDSSGQFAYGIGGDQIFQYSIGSDGLLSPMTPASVPATTSVAGFAVTGGNPSTFGYALSSCVNTDCDGEVALYTLAPAGGLTPTSTTTLTTTHVIPVAFALGDAFLANNSAYLLANFMGVDTQMGMVLPYGVDQETGALTPGAAVFLQSGLGAVAEVLGPGAVDNRPGAPLNLYALSSKATALPGRVETGGQIDQYVVGESGAIAYNSSTPLTTGTPVAMAIAAMNLVVPATP